MTAVDYTAVLAARYSDKRWQMNGDDYDGMTWLDAGDPPSRSELDAEWPAVRDGLAWGRVRAERDRLLAASDWTQVADAPVDSAAWAVYRQELRDVPQDFATPDAVVWPAAPA